MPGLEHHAHAFGIRVPYHRHVAHIRRSIPTVHRVHTHIVPRMPVHPSHVVMHHRMVHDTGTWKVETRN